MSLDKKLVTAELDNIFNLILASIDPNHLIKMAMKLAGGEHGVGSLTYAKNAWNKGIQLLIDQNNKENSGKPPIEVPKNYDFFGYVFNKLKGSGDNQAEAQEGASWVLYYCFIPGAAERSTPKQRTKNWEDGEVKWHDTKVMPKSPQEIVQESEEDNTIYDVISFFRKKLDSGKFDERYSLITAFQARANEGIHKWYATKKDLAEMQPSRKKDDESDSTVDMFEEMAGPDKAVEEILEENLNKNFFDFIEEEKKQGLVSSQAYALLKLKQQFPKIKRDVILKELKLIPEIFAESDDAHALQKKAIEQYHKLLTEIKYMFARYAYTYDDAELLASMKRKDPQGRFLLPSDANMRYNPTQEKFVHKDIIFLTDFLDDNYDKSFTIIKKDLAKYYNPKLIAQLEKAYNTQGSVSNLLELLERFKTTRTEKDLLEFAETNKKSSSKKAFIIEYLNELISRL